MDLHQDPQRHGTGATATTSPGQGIVTIIINNVPVHITGGRHSVAEVKAAGGVPAADDLEQVIDGQLRLLPDDGYVVIQGREVFVSHPKSTSSS